MSKSIGEWQAEVHGLAVSKGWHEEALSDAERVYPDRIAAKLALVHSEVSEALEELRLNGSALGMYTAGLANSRLGEIDKPEGFVVELADAVIRIMDTCGALGLDLEGAIEAKHAYNKTRAHRHGGKVL